MPTCRREELNLSEGVVSNAGTQRKEGATTSWFLRTAIGWLGQLRLLEIDLAKQGASGRKGLLGTYSKVEDAKGTTEGRGVLVKDRIADCSHCRAGGSSQYDGQPTCRPASRETTGPRRTRL